MFETLSHLALQQYWWAIISLLGGILVFLMFVQGGQTLIYTLGKTETQRSVVVNSLGRKWEFTFTTLVTFGGAFFASFPLFYATSFGGAYWVWIIILFVFTMQAISYEFRKKPNNVFGSRTYETFLLLNGLIGTVFIGIAVGTFFNGSMFVLNDMNQVTWQGPARGLEAALNYKNVLLGLSVFFLARTLAILYFMNDIDSQDIFRRAKKHLYFNSIPFVILFLAFIITVFTAEGFAYSPQGEVYREPMKYLNNLIENPLLGILFLAGVGLVLSGIVMSLVRNTGKGIWYTGGGTILTVFCLFLVAGYNNTPFYPSVYDLQSSLTIENSSSSKFTLTVMSYVSLIVPFVIAYIFYAWRAINKHQISEEEMEKESHSY